MRDANPHKHHSAVRLLTASAAFASALVWFMTEAAAHSGNLRRPVGETTDAEVPWLQWDFHPSIFFGILTMAVIYTLGVTVWRKKYNWSTALPKAHMFRFYSACVAQWWLLDGPLHYLSDERSFFAHMVQHLSLQMLWAPLLISGIPGWLLRPLVRKLKAERFGRWITRPVRAALFFNAMLLGWHIPELYDLALRTHPVHILQHLLFMSASVVFWWPILSPLSEVPRAPYGVQAFYIMLNLAPMKALGLIIAVHNELIYTFYASQPRVWGLTPVGDQRAGGLTMWVIGGLPLWAALAYVFVQWKRTGTPAKGMSGVADLDDTRVLGAAQPG